MNVSNEDSEESEDSKDSAPPRKRQRRSSLEGENSQVRLEKPQIDDQNQSKNAEQISQSQEPPAAAGKSIDDLAQAQLVHILKYLDFVDLLNVANATKKLQEAAGAIYSEKYGDLLVSYSESASNGTNVIVKVDVIEVKEARTCLKMFRGFGTHLKAVQLNFDGINRRRSHLISQKLNEYCADSMIDLDWFHCPADAMNESSKKWPQLQSLRMKYGDLGEQMSKFSHFFPALNRLELEEIQVADRKCIECTIPKLVLLKVNIESRKKLDFLKSNLKAALKVNPQLKGLGIGSGCELKLLKYINKNLPALQLLAIHNPCKQFFDSEESKIRFDEVQTVFLDISNSKDSFTNIPFEFPRLRKFTLKACPPHRDEWIDFVVGHPQLVKLNLLNFHWFLGLSQQQLMKIVMLTELKHFVLDWKLPWKNSLIRFISKCHSLKTLRLTVPCGRERNAICALVDKKWQAEVDKNSLTLKRTDN